MINSVRVENTAARRRPHSRLPNNKCVCIPIVLLYYIITVLGIIYYIASAVVLFIFF